MKDTIDLKVIDAPKVLTKEGVMSCLIQRYQGQQITYTQEEIEKTAEQYLKDYKENNINNPKYRL
jgi:hypothetical protein